MQRTALLASLVFALASLGACTPINRDNAYRAPTGSLSGTPQSPNSLPEGASVNSPLTSRTGNVATTVTSPPVPAERRVTPYR